jgi:hypothetical protein
VIKIGAIVNRISQMSMAARIVRNDEVVGSIPTSSTKFTPSCCYPFQCIAGIEAPIIYLAIRGELVCPTI